ncbi:hypothetical protein 4L372X_028 [Aeromonas phage 4_L372X]|nr:hypothetical protein 4L372X_028 [Aeromonas phage 4_L372X]
MTCYNSMKADEYAQRQGEMDELDALIEEAADAVCAEFPEFIQNSSKLTIDDIVYEEAKRRVMQAIKERNEP